MIDNLNDLNQPVKIKTTKDLGVLVRKYRDFQKMTQADILGLANTGNRFIVDLENGKPTVQFQKVLDVLDTLGLEVLIQKKGSLS
jgi:y4mF family transcriptional regulator